MSTITGMYGHIWVSPCDLDVITGFRVKKGQNVHDEAYIFGCISEETLLYYQNCVEESTVISIHFEEDGKKQLMFSGLPDRMEVEELNGQYDVRLYLSGLTKQLDHKKKILDYQDGAKTVSGIIAGIMKGYPDVSYRIGAADKNLEPFLLQYEETDYAFLKRLLSLEQEPVFTRSNGERGEINFGKVKGGTAAALDLVSYEIEFDELACELDRKNQRGVSDGKEYLQYRVKPDVFLQIGDRVSALGKELYVKAVEYARVDGISENSYLLCEEKGLYAGKCYNSIITGISMDGTITKVQRDKVKVELDATPKTGEEKARWFCYSTAASSKDGSGWYCMPKKGEQIRLFFPTEREEDAYVISAIRSNGGGGAGGGTKNAKTPQNKSLSTDSGQEVKFTDKGTEIQCAKGAASMLLNKDGSLEITSKGDIELIAGDGVKIRSERGALTMQAGGKILLTNQAGSSFEILQNITVEGNKIKNNS